MPGLIETKDWHEQVKALHNIPLSVAYLIDEVFESQDSFEEAAAFAVEVIEAIPVGANLDTDNFVHTDWFGEDEPKNFCCLACRYSTTDGGTKQFLEDLRSAPVIQ